MTVMDVKRHGAETITASAPSGEVRRALVTSMPGLSAAVSNTASRTVQRYPFMDLRSDFAFAQLIRFALVGGLANISYLLLFMALHVDGVQIANIVGSIVSTAIANELHRRLTFHASDRVGWFTAQWEGGGLALVALAASSAALAGLGVLFPGTDGLTQALFVIAVSGLVGGLRFLALRGWVF